jgi:LysM repeat protein
MRKKSRKKCGKGKLSAGAQPSHRQACQTKRLMPKFGAMKVLAMSTAAILCGASLGQSLSAQTSAPAPAKSPEMVQLETLAKKIDEQNAKIDALSQQILKLQQEISQKRPGVIIGENAPEATPAAPPDSAAHAAAENTHTVARGETLTSIAKMYKVSVDELQRVNHIDNPLKLQAGQTLTIPTPATATTPSASPPGQ